MIEDLICSVVNTPTKENIDNYLNFVNMTEYSLLVEAENFSKKSQKYFDKRKEAFSYRRNSAIDFINNWVQKYGSTENSPITYADTLNIPFQSIKAPKDA